MIGILIAVGIISISSVAPSSQAQQIKARSEDGIVIEGPGIWKKILLPEGEYREEILISPDGHKVIYHDKFDPYKPPPLPKPVTTFTVIDVATGGVIHKIPLYWGSGSRGRLLYGVEWIDGRFVSVMGEESFGILDTHEGRQIHNLWGRNFSLAPNRRLLLFIRGTPRIYFHEEYKSLLSEYVMLALIDKGQPVDEGATNRTAMTIYPEVYPFGELGQRVYRNLNERHFIKSGFCWFPDSRRVAFVEEHRGALWLVVLTLDVGDTEVKVVPRRFKVAEEPGDVTVLEWMGDGRGIRVVVQGVTYLVDLERGTVQAHSK